MRKSSFVVLWLVIGGPFWMQAQWTVTNITGQKTNAFPTFTPPSGTPVNYFIDPTRRSIQGGFYDTSKYVPPTANVFVQKVYTTNKPASTTGITVDWVIDDIRYLYEIEVHINATQDNILGNNIFLEGPGGRIWQLAQVKQEIGTVLIKQTNGTSDLKFTSAGAATNLMRLDEYDYSPVSGTFQPVTDLKAGSKTGSSYLVKGNWRLRVQVVSAVNPFVLNFFDVKFKCIDNTKTFEDRSFYKF